MGCLGTVEQRYLINLIKNAAKNGYTRFVEPCAGTFAMSNLAIQNGYKPEQIETSDVSMMSSVMGYADNGNSHTAGVYADTERSLYEGYVRCFFVPGGNQTGYPGCGSQRNIGHV